MVFSNLCASKDLVVKFNSPHKTLNQFELKSVQKQGKKIQFITTSIRLFEMPGEIWI